ncbi:MAG TPA: hypothetical protein VK041_10060 [Opitutales bacterium]|nr:hypothetical protein [Opitutales bacterium]
MPKQVKKGPPKSPKSIIDVWRVNDNDGVSFYDDDFADVVEFLKNMKSGSELVIRREKVKKADFDEAPDYDGKLIDEFFVPDYFWEESR